MLYIFVSNTLPVSQINSKDFRLVMMQVTQKEQVSKDFENKIIDRTSSKHFTSITYNVRHSFLDWEPKCGDNIHHTVLSSATGLESLKSLASDRASFLDSFSSIG